MPKARSSKQVHNEGFALRLKMLRQQQHLSQTELGEMAGIHFTTISRYERGEGLPNTDALQGLSKALGVSADFLVHGEEDTKAAPLQDGELLLHFREIEAMPVEERDFVKKVIEALLLRRRVQALAG